MIGKDLIQEAIDDMRRKMQTDFPSCKCAEQDYCGCNGKRDIAIVANDFEQGKQFAIERGLEMVRIHTIPREFRGFKFGPDKTVYVLTDQDRLIKSLLPCLKGCRIEFVNDWQYEI